MSYYTPSIWPNGVGNCYICGEPTGVGPLCTIHGKELAARSKRMMWDRIKREGFPPEAAFDLATFHATKEKDPA